MQTCAQVPAPHCSIKTACKDQWLARVTLQCHNRLHTQPMHEDSCRKRSVCLLGTGSDSNPCSQGADQQKDHATLETLFLVTGVWVVDAVALALRSAKRKLHSYRFC
ncbi:TPA: hypothetical protein ACH3X1_015430 [Trebouxia sp. C0004]